jgi:hypothetical protein
MSRSAKHASAGGMISRSRSARHGVPQAISPNPELRMPSPAPLLSTTSSIRSDVFCICAKRFGVRQFAPAFLQGWFPSHATIPMNDLKAKSESSLPAACLPVGRAQHSNGHGTLCPRVFLPNPRLRIPSPFPLFSTTSSLRSEHSSLPRRGYRRSLRFLALERQALTTSL